MALQTLPSSARRYSREQRREIAAALAAVRRLWGRMGNDFDVSWSQIQHQVIAVLDMAQRTTANAATEYIPAVLADTGQTVQDAEYRLNVASLVGTAGDGRPTESLARGAVIRAKAAVGNGATTTEALASGRTWLSLATTTLLADTRRTAEAVAMGSRQVTGYVRMLNPPSCGRCIILAGKWFRHNQGFQRHPGCDCTHIPASESIAGDMLVDPRAYLESLDESDLVKVLGSKANARAFTDGADVNQMINVYRNAGAVQTAQIHGATIKYTTQSRNEIWRSRGRNGGWRTHGRDDGRWSYRFHPNDVTAGERYMPETIYEIAGDDRDLARELLRQYGWIL